ncbi:MAG: DUF4174 domain-containing protein [Rhizobiaceae bacterium]|nr:DUF4174 domain-containing protein [Rhizobiaceae bacterium]
MKTVLLLISSLSMCIFAFAHQASFAQDISAYKGEKRPLIVFTSRDTHRKYSKQIKILEGARPALEERDVAVLVDTEKTPASTLRLEFLPGEFMVVLVGKDGEVKLKSTEPVSIDELVETIDRMPMRQQEMQKDG